MRVGSWLAVAALIAAAFPATLAAPRADPPAKAPEAEVPFLIGVEDVLKIVVWGEPQLSLSVKVRPDGKITVPLVNDVKVVGLSPDEVRTKIAAELGKFVRDPNVTVIVESYLSFRVYFLGEVGAQGPIQFFGPTRILQAVASVGGLSQYSKKELTLVREVGGVATRTQIDYKRILAGEPGEENVLLIPGDVIIAK